MKNTIVLSLVILSIFTRINSVFCINIKNYQEAMDYYKKAHIEFIKLNYTEAIKYYTEIEKFLEKNIKYKTYFDHHYRDFSMIDIVKRHKNLGIFKPLIEHKIIVLYIKNTDTQFKDKKINAVFTDELKEAAYISQEICKKQIEVLSKGKMTVSFSRLDIDAYVTELSSSISINNDTGKIEIVQAVIESLNPYPWEIIYKNIQSYDTFLFYWNDNRLTTGNNGGGAKALGGASNLPIFPYQLYSSKRGRIIISASLLDRPGTLLHEIFHTIENKLDIKPIHGFYNQNRKYFPDWKGKGEFNYYEYHFDQIIKDNKISDLEFIKSFPDFTDDRVIEKNHNTFKEISYSNLNLAQKLYIQANELMEDKKKQNDAEKLFEKILEINPSHLDSLIKLCVINHNNNKKSIALDFITRAYEINPLNSSVCYWMGVEHYNQNKIDAALKYLTEGLKYSPKSSIILQYRSFVYYQNKNYSEAEKDFTYLLEISPDNKKWIINYLEGKKKQKNTNAERIMKKLNL